METSIELGNISLMSGLRMQPSDLDDVVQIHMIAFPNFFLTFLGKNFLRELYSAILSDHSGISFVFRSHDRNLGFVAGTEQLSGFYRRLLVQRWWRFALASVIPVINKPSIIPRLLRAFNMPKQTSTHNDRYTLMSLAVLPEVQGRGIGAALVGLFLSEAAQRGAKKVDLLTDSLDNDEVNAFYQKLGFTIDRSFVTPEGRHMNEYVIDL